MEESFKENGLIIIWKEWVYIPGLMVGDMKENIKTTKNMVMVYMNG